MNILLTTIGIYPHIGGKSTHIKNLTKGLVELGHNVKIISYSDTSYFKWFFLVRAPRFCIRKIPIVGKKLAFYWTTLVLEYLTKKLITHELKTKKYDAISAQDVITSSMCRNVIDNLGINIPVIATNHGDYKNEILSAGYFSKGTPTERWLLNREINGYIASDAIIAVDNRLKEHVTALTLNKVAKKLNLKVMFNFLDLSEFTPIDLKYKTELKKQWAHQIEIDACILLCPRRLTAKNGVIYAALMCKYLMNTNPDFKFQLVFAGDGEDKQKINEIIQLNGLESIIRLLGDVKHEDMRSLYGIADIVLVPSVPSEGVIEATSLSALEAMACGVPVIASNIGGLAELICDGKTGVLVEPTDTVAIAEAVIKLMSDAEVRSQIQNNAIEYVNNNHSHLVAAKQFVSYCENTA